MTPCTGRAEVTTGAPPQQAVTASADVGDAVAGVLRAAEETAERIRGEAKNQAREIIEGATPTRRPGSRS